MQAGDAHVVYLVADAQAPVGLAEKVVGLLDAVVQTEQHGAHLFAVGIYFILYERVAVVIAGLVRTGSLRLGSGVVRLGTIIVIVEPFVLVSDFAGNGTPELVDFPGTDVRIEGDCEESKLFHLGVFG
jgi:hypothetical protein